MQAEPAARRNARELAVLRAGEDLDDVLARALSQRSDRRRFRTGRVGWTELDGVREAVRTAARGHLGACRPDAARPLVDLLLDAPDGAGRTSRELAGYLRVLDGDPRAEECLAAAVSGPPAQRRSSARRLARAARSRLALRAAVADLPTTTRRAAAARADVLDASWLTPGAIEATAVRYLATVLADASAAGLDELVGLLVDGGHVEVSTLDVPGVEHVVARAAERAADGDHDAALAMMAGLPARPEAMTASALLQLADLLTARSRYTEARTVLRVAATATDAPVRVAAHVRASRVAWTTHDLEETGRQARAAIGAGASRRSVAGLRRCAAEPVTPPEAPGGGVGHVAFYVEPGGNFGDVALPIAVRASVEAAAGPQSWAPFHAHQMFGDEQVRLANTQRALVVGGGGLFLPDTAPNGNSGWQWNVPASSLEALEVPLFVDAVGYNLFRGQEFHGPLFRDGLVALTRRAEFVGLRNHGSMDRVRELLPDDLHDKVRFVPCPTTVYERLGVDLPEPTTGTGRVLLNAAFDRSGRRFGDYPRFLAEVHRAVAALTDSGAEVRVVAHTTGDVHLATDLRERFGTDLAVDELHRATPEEAFATYRSASLVVGMRGHATMVPFGLGTPVVSIVSHPKLRYFLDDVGRPEWGVEVGDAHLGDRLTELARDVLDREQAYRDDVRERQLVLLGPVQDAAAQIAASLREPEPAHA